jgi:hypothetical protein
VVAVGRDAGETARRARRVARAADGLLRAQFRRYAAAAARAPRCRSRSPLLDRFVRCAPLYEEALKVSDTPGARRAKTSTYWVWLWDAILPALVDPWVGDGAFAAATARFFARYLHPRTGAPFAFPYDLSTLRVSPPGSRRPRLPRPEFHMQGLVEILAHDTAALSADASLLPELYPALRPHFESMAATTVGSTGLLRGRCAFPDARPLFDETGETVSGENNGVWYNACRKMERMALRMNDPATAHLARETALAIERHFWRLLWNRREQCLAGAAHPAKGQTDVFPSTSAFWDFGYGDELCDGYQRRLVAYHLKHFYSPMGITFLSPFRPRLWDRDGNQFHCSWPVLDSHMLKLALWAQNAEALRQFLPWLESLMARHTVPEAIQMRVWKDHPVVYDPGAWQAYTISSWYRVVVECLLGVTLDEGGVTLTGTPAAPMALRGLHYRGTRLDIETRGRGWNLASLTLDGVKLLGTNKIAAALLRGRRHRMVVTRSAQPSARWHVVRANGSSVGIARAGRDALAFTLTGTGLSRVLLYAPGLRRIRHNGQAAAARRAERPGCWWFETVFEQAGAEGRIEAEGI